MNFLKDHWEALLVGGGLGIAGLLIAQKSGASTTTVVTPAAPTPTPTPLPPAPPASTTTLTLVGGEPQVSLGVQMGALVVIQLPPGAYWTQSNGAAISGNSPISWVYQGAGTVVLGWVDATMQPQETTINLYSQGF